MFTHSINLNVIAFQSRLRCINSQTLIVESTRSSHTQALCIYRHIVKKNSTNGIFLIM